MEKIFGQAVQARRQLLGISQKEIARQLKLSVNKIADIERGEPGLSLGKIVKVCEALNLSAGEMLKSLGDMFKIEPVAKRKNS
jgi:transcriptional regulator with XRE-family HTH domain